MFFFCVEKHRLDLTSYSSPLYSTDMSPFCIQPRLAEALQAGDHQDGVSSPTGTQFDFSPSNLEQLQEEDQETFRYLQGLDFLFIVPPHQGCKRASRVC